MTEKNEYSLYGENYWAPYQKGIADLRNNPEVIEFDKLCYELFEHQETGRKFIQIIKDNYLIPALAMHGSQTYQIEAVWAEGYKDAWRKVIHAITSHKQRINHEGI